MNSKVKQVLDGLLEKFKTGDVPQAVAYSIFPATNEIPSAKWSFLNRTIMFISGTGDARGFRQWQQVNRYVKKGAKAFYILVPCIYKKQADDEEKLILGGFKPAPVFRLEDTDGEPLDYQLLKPPDLPLMERAREWGIAVKAIGGHFKYYGYYSGGRKEIGLATQEEKVFFHELAHAGHEKVKGTLKPGQDPLQEIVAELSAQALCHLAGKQANNTLGNSYQYIERYAQKINLSPYAACLKVMSETEKVLTLILKGEEDGKGENNSRGIEEAA